MTATATKRRPKAATIEIAHADLQDALRAVKAAVPTRGIRPVLQNVLLSDGVLTATDLELRIDYAVDAVTPPILLPHDRLSKILEYASGDAVELTPQGPSCVVEIGSGRWTLPTEDAAEFPADPGGAADPICRLPADQFCRAVAGTAFACDPKSARAGLGAVLIEVCQDEENPEEMRAHFVASDGRRLARVDVEIDQAVDASKTLIPQRAIQAMADLCRGRDEAVQFERRGTEVICTCGGVTITAKTTEPNFPKWRDVFPKRKSKPSAVSAGSLLASTLSAAIVTSEQSKGVSYTFTGDGLHLSARSSESGESSVTCELSEFGKQAVTKLDPKFVREWLKTIDTAATVLVDVEDGESACVLRHEESSCVIMPLSEDA